MERQLYMATANRACSLLYSYIKEHNCGMWLLPVNVCPDVPLTFCLANVPFQFVDINPKTLCIDTEEVDRILHQSSSDYAGVLYVRTYGVLKDTSEEFENIKSISKKILIIDDRCLCVPERNPQFWGADMLLYSTGHCKQIDFSGGGLAFYKEENRYAIDEDLFYNGTDEECLYKKAFGEGKPFKEVPEGWLKMDTYLPIKDYLSNIDNAIPKRQVQRELINSIYTRLLPACIQLSSDFQSWRFNIKVAPNLKDKILKELFKKGLFASSHYHSVNRLFDKQEYPISDSLFKSVINLFNDNYYSQKKAIETCEIINKIVNIN